MRAGPRYQVPLYRVRLVKERTVTYAARTAEHSDHAAAVFRQLFNDLDRETVAVLYLNARAVILGAEIVAIGGVSSAYVHAREVFKGALAANASAIILGHNHPSGDPSPSAEDRELTRVVADAGKLLGVTLLDHVIIARGTKHASFFSLGLLA